MDPQKTRGLLAITACILFVIALICNVTVIQKNKHLKEERDRAILFADSVLGSKLNADKQLELLSDDFYVSSKKLKEYELMAGNLKQEHKQEPRVSTNTK